MSFSCRRHCRTVVRRTCADIDRAPGRKAPEHCERIALAAELVSQPTGQQCLVSSERRIKALAAAIPDAVGSPGSMSADEKSAIMAFTHGESGSSSQKASICGWGMNWQHCMTWYSPGLMTRSVVLPGCAPLLSVRAKARCRRASDFRRSEGAVKANLERKQQAQSMTWLIHGGRVCANSRTNDQTIGEIGIRAR